MNCEICEVIERLDLDMSSHDLWFCVDGQSGRQNNTLNLFSIEEDCPTRSHR
jgi:hypothetical protein